LEDMGRKAHQRHAESDESRARRYAEAALESELKALDGSPTGNRNDQLNRSAFALGQFVAAGVLSEAEVIRALSNAAIYAGLEMEEIRATITSGLEAGARHPREIPEQTRRKAEDWRTEGPTVLTAFQALIDHEDRIKGECVWEWRLQKQRIQTAIKTGYLSQKGEEKAHKFLKQFKGILGDLGIDYDNLYPLLLKPKDNKEEFSDEIKAKALEVLKNGDPVQYVADACGRLALGAEAAFKKLVSCVSVQNIRQSSGLHPKLTGNSSGGKTWTVYSFAHHLPYEMVVKGSMSAKAGFYHSDGDRVLRILDDYQAGNEDLDTVIKQTSSEFHEPYTHRTVIKQIAAKLEIGSEQTWAITSVNNDQDIQVLNRAIPINVDDSVDLTKKVNNRTVERYGAGEAAKPVDEAVLVCRAMFQILRDEGYINVRVPFWERIEWLDTSNRRNPSIFMDLVIAHTAMFRYQREKDSEGYYLATEEDFQAAKSLFADKDGEELVKRLTRREREVLELLVGSPSGITRADVSERLDIAPQQVSRIFNGRNGEGGLLQKIAIREEEISDSTRINDTDYRAVKKILYSLKEYDRFAGLEGIVKLKPQKDDENTPPPDKTDGGRSGNHEETNEETIQTASSGNHETKETINKNKNKNKNRETVSSSSVDGETILSHAGEKDGFLGFHKATDSERDGFLNDSSSGSSGHEETIFCVTCGEDLTGKGTVTKNGLSYCARPGCGYPPRGEA
uniref:helix-turn-helix transcriptional regulator n=1 Tax=Methanothrix soehngenii TaxID=2223 RepID=UPI002FE1D299